MTRLLRAGLTNNPNLYLTAIAAAQSIAGGDKDGLMDDLLKQLRELLKLGEDANPADIVDRVREMCASAAAHEDENGEAMSLRAPDPAKYVGVAEFKRALTELNGLKAERAREKAGHAVDDAIRAGKIIPAQREWAIAYCSADSKGFQGFVAKQPSIVTGESGLLGEPPSASAATLTSAEHAICAQLGLKHSDYLKRKIGRTDFLRLERGEAEQDR